MTPIASSFHARCCAMAMAVAVMSLIFAAPLRADLLAYYDFDDPADTFADSSGKGNHITGTAGTNPVWGAHTGFNNSGAYDFSADRLIVPIDVNASAMPKMTWGAWVRTDSLTSGLRKVMGQDNGAWDRVLGLDNRIDSGAAVDFRYTAFTGITNAGPVEGGPAPVNTTDWTFLAASHDQANSTVTLYLDLDATTSADPLVVISETNASYGSGFNTFAIGGIRPDNASEAWDGAIDNVFIYDEVLDPAAVTALRDGGSIAQPPRIDSFTAVPAFISSGETATLSWSSSGADSVSIDMGAGAISGDSGSVGVSPMVTTTYTLTATNMAGAVTDEVTVGVDVIVLAPVITEFMASNGGTLDDGDGNSSDWIEIYNPNPFDLNLAGYALQDSTETWVFPNVSVVPGGYLIVFASGQSSPDYVDGEGFHHTTFRLSASGEVLRLLDSDGETVLIEFTGLPAQQTDVSWGIDPDTQSQGFFVPATPAGANGPALSDFVSDTQFDIGRGFFTAPITVTITSDTPDAFIAYTTDGSPPSPTNGTIVNPGAPGQSPAAAVAISTTTVLRAMAYRAGWAPTNIDTNTYLFLGDVIDQPAMPAGFPSTWGLFTGANSSSNGSPIPADYEMKPAIVNEDRPGMIAALESLPTMSIVADPDDLFSNEGILTNPFADVNGSGVYSQQPFVPDRPCSLEWFQADGTLETQVDCGVRLVGGWSRHYSATPKKSLRLIFKSEFGASTFNFPLFGEGEIDEFQKVQLRATFSDAWVDNARPAQYLRDPFVRESYLAMGQPGSRGNFVHLYLNGLYWGIYNPTERPDADFGASHFGGGDEGYDALKHQGLTGPGGAATNAFEVIDGTASRWQEALTVTGGNMADPLVYDEFKEYVDVVSLADYFLVNSFLSNTDWPGKNWYAFGRRDGSDGGFKFSPWDSEYSLHDLNGNRINVSGTNTPARFYDRARANPEFRLLFADRIHKHAYNDGPLTTAAMMARYAEMADLIEPAIGAEAARWGDNPNTRMGNRDYRKSHWLSTRNSVLNNFLANRHPIAIAQYRAANLYPSIDAPEFNQHGGVLDPPSVITFVDPPPGTIYYTTDGSDPRLEGGAVNPAAGLLTGGSVTKDFVDFEENGWRYFVTSSGLGDSEIVDGSPAHPGYGPGNWKHPDFDDSVWPQGQALLGYGGISGTAVNTTIDFGGDFLNKYPTSYFRKEFTVVDASTVSRLLVDVIRDDGAILYVNGHELGRTNMTAGNQSYLDLASADASPENAIIPFTYVLPPGVLRNGSNILAVEVHQRSVSSSDLGIDAKIRGTIANSGITLAGSGTVKARVLSPGNEWSALTEAFFTVAAQPASATNLLVSKIHYHPAAPSQAEIAAGFTSSNNFEFLELLNYGPETLSLAGVSLLGGITFNFAPNAAIELAPGERVVLVENTAAFELRYGAGFARIVGQYSGRLSDDGEEIILNDSAGSEIWRFTFNDAGAWPDTPDGGGTALTLIDQSNTPTNAGLSSPESWRPSSISGGSPGSDDRLSLSGWLATQADPDPLADPDGDGINQLIAFATGALDAPDAVSFQPRLSLETINIEGVDAFHAVYSVRRLTGGLGISSAVRQSLDLNSWADAGMVLLDSSGHEDGTYTVRYRSAQFLAPGSSSVQYYRLSVSTMP